MTTRIFGCQMLFQSMHGISIIPASMFHWHSPLRIWWVPSNVASSTEWRNKQSTFLTTSQADCPTVQGRQLDSPRAALRGTWTSAFSFTSCPWSCIAWPSCASLLATAPESPSCSVAGGNAEAPLFRCSFSVSLLRTQLHSHPSHKIREMRWLLLLSTSVAKLLKTGKARCWGERGGMGTLLHCCGSSHSSL